MIRISIIFTLLNSTLFCGMDEFCFSKWGSNTSMLEHCKNQQIEANNKFFRIAEEYGLSSGGSISVNNDGSDIERIFFKCMNQWEKPKYQTRDFTMVVHCLEQQITSYKVVSQPNIMDSETGKYCFSQWEKKNDYVMIEHCYEKQVESNKILFKVAEDFNFIVGNSISVSGDSNDPNELKIFNCMNKWNKKEFNTYDYPMVVHCLKR